MQRENFDVVATDGDMPHLDQCGLLFLSRAAWPHTPVIILSGGPAESSEVVTQLGAYAWIEKPYNTYVLLEIIGNAAQAAAQTT
jgi:two-component system response regulator HydG